MTAEIALREVTASDIPIFFEQQLDPEARVMAAFASKDSTDEKAYRARWSKHLQDERIITRTILVNGMVAGSVFFHTQFGEPEIGYWLGRAYWGQGAATRALALFLEVITIRPLYAYTAKDNIGSLRVLEKCGFIRCGEQAEYSEIREQDVEQYILRLDASATHQAGAAS